MEFNSTNLSIVSKSIPILRASHEGILRIGELEIPCFVVNEERLISVSAINEIFGTKGSHRNLPSAQIPRILVSNQIKPFISAELSECTQSIVEFKKKNGSGRNITGFRAEILPLMCETIMDAAKEEVLEKDSTYIKSAEILMRGLMRVGVTALIDEATGFQSNREKDGLQKILNRYLQPYARRWILTFPKEFFDKIYKVYNIKVEGSKRPGYIGILINDLVYDRLAPGITQKLKENNPKITKKDRKYKHHQLFTEQEGYPELKSHIIKLMCLMDAAQSTEHFKTLVAYAMPKYSESKLPPLELYAQRTPSLW